MWVPTSMGANRSVPQLHPGEFSWCNCGRETWWHGCRRMGRAWRGPESRQSWSWRSRWGGGVGDSDGAKVGKKVRGAGVGMAVAGGSMRTMGADTQLLAPVFITLLEYLISNSIPNTLKLVREMKRRMLSSVIAYKADQASVGGYCCHNILLLTLR